MVYSSLLLMPVVGKHCHAGLGRDGYGQAFGQEFAATVMLLLARIKVRNHIVRIRIQAEQPEACRLIEAVLPPEGLHHALARFRTVKLPRHPGGFVARPGR